MTSDATLRRKIPAFIIRADGRPAQDRGLNDRLRDLALYAQEYVERAGSFTTFLLLGPLAMRQCFECAVGRLPHAKGIVIFCGHGCEDGWFETQRGGSRPTTRIADTTNCRYLRRKIVFAAACYSAKRLGPLSVTTGAATCYIGYHNKVYIYRENGPTEGYTTPLKAGIKALAKHKQCFEAYDAMRNEYWRCIDTHMDRDELYDALILMNSLDALCKPLGNDRAFV
jgi:hypothetical protein